MKIAVIKISGKAVDEIINNDSFALSLEALKEKYGGIIIVHGAGTLISEWSDKIGLKVEFVNGQRVTDKPTMDIVAAVQTGILNSKIVSKLISSGLDVIGLTGIDRNLFIAEYIDKEMGYVGKPRAIRSADWLKDMLFSGVIPVYSSICRDVDGNLMNVNADIFTEVLAETVQADSVFFFSDVDGVILNGEVQNELDPVKIKQGMLNGEIKGGMIPKLNSCVALLNKGINKIWIGSNNLGSNINEITNNQVSGTWIRHAAVGTAATK